MAGFVLARFIMLGVTFLVIPFIYWTLSMSLEKAMAPHSSILTWRIPGTEEPGGLPSVGSHRVGHN